MKKSKPKEQESVWIYISEMNKEILLVKDEDIQGKDTDSYAQTTYDELKKLGKDLSQYKIVLF